MSGAGAALAPAPGPRQPGGVCNDRTVQQPDMLAGVDDVPWQDLRHAYGPADDVPALLRALALGSGEADDPLETLCGSICHQGSVYSATPYAVSFLARIAAAGIRAVAVLGLLGWIADSDDECGLDVPGAARAAVAGQIDVLAPLLADPDAEVRVTTVWALTQCRAPDLLVPLLRPRWDAETRDTVKAAVLKALSVLDTEGAVGLAEGVLAGSSGSGLLLMAATACVAAGIAWSDRLHEAATAWMADGELLPGFFWSDRDPFADLVVALAAHGNPGAALRLVAAGLTGPFAGAVRQRAVWAADELAEGYRSPAAGLVIPLAAVIGDDDAGPAAVSLLARLAGAPAAARQFAVVADELVAVADVPGPGRRADQALACLFEVGDPRATALLARDLRHRPSALDAATFAARGRLGPPLPFDPVLLEAARVRLAATDTDHKSGVFLLALLGAWGPAAGSAIPEVLGMLSRNPVGASVTLAAIGGPAQSAADALSQAAVSGPVPQRLHAAAALRSLTGDDQPLLAAIEHGLRRRRGYELRAAVQAAQGLGTTSGRLVSALTAALHDTAGPDAQPPDVIARVELALALWQHAGDATAAIPVLADALSRDPRRFTRGTATAAADAAATIGPAARTLIPAILALLDHPAQSPAAVQALLRIDPGSHGGVDIAVLADRLVTAVGTDSGAQRQALAALKEIGTARLPPAATDRLRRLAAQDQRIIHSGYLAAIIRNDEGLRAAISELVDKPARSASHFQ